MLDGGGWWWVVDAGWLVSGDPAGASTAGSDSRGKVRRPNDSFQA